MRRYYNSHVKISMKKMQINDWRWKTKTEFKIDYESL